MVSKASAGVMELMPVYSVNNIIAFLQVRNVILLSAKCWYSFYKLNYTHTCSGHIQPISHIDFYYWETGLIFCNMQGLSLCGASVVSTDVIMLFCQ